MLSTQVNRVLTVLDDELPEVQSMPTYHYRCSACDEHLEMVQSMTDDPLTECPRCGGTLQKVFRTVGIVLKGSGFYRTDSRSGSRSTAKVESNGDSGSGGAKKDKDSAKKSKPKGGSSDSSASSSSSSGTKPEAKSA